MATTAKVNEAATPMTTVRFQVSVHRCRRTGRVLYLEAGKDFVDALVGFLLLPIGTINLMLASAGVAAKGLGGISSLFASMKQLDSSLLHVDKAYLMQPRPAVTDTCNSIALVQVLNAAKLKSLDLLLPGKYYRCNGGRNCYNLSSTEGTPCTTCPADYYRRPTCFGGQIYSVIPEDREIMQNGIMERLSVESVMEGVCSTGQGFVSDSITYMVTDELEVMTSTTIKNIEVLNKLKVATLSDVERSDVVVNLTQILQLLQSALTSSTCLNDVFEKKVNPLSCRW
ncbi:hypothetical protein M758_7G161400 [Ceratodon purpureus]|nr:hypothetical protein M758_7G161400 [Ceratodon purpureus]